MSKHKTSFEHAFQIGQIVYLRTDSDQERRIVNAIIICPNSLMYTLGKGPDQSDHYEFELTAERDESYSMGIDKSKGNKE